MKGGHHRGLGFIQTQATLMELLGIETERGVTDIQKDPQANPDPHQETADTRHTQIMKG